MFSDTLWVCFGSVVTPKNDCAIKFLKNLYDLSNWGIKICLFHLFSKNITCITCFNKKKKKKEKERRKLTKSRFSKDKNLFSKLGAFSYALSPLFGTSKNHSPLFQKKNNNNKIKEKKPFQKINGHSCIRFPN